MDEKSAKEIFEEGMWASWEREEEERKRGIRRTPPPPSVLEWRMEHEAEWQLRKLKKAVWRLFGK